MLQAVSYMLQAVSENRFRTNHKAEPTIESYVLMRHQSISQVYPRPSKYIPFRYVSRNVSRAI